MLSDRKATEIVSKSFHGELSNEEESVVSEHLESSPNSEAFAQLSSVIQDSVSVFAVAVETGSDDEVPGLSEDAKSRLRDSVHLALRHRIPIADYPTISAEADSSVSPPSPAPETDENGREISLDDESRGTRTKFKLLRKLGEGGLGTVWIAREEKLKRTVALKEMNLKALESPKAWQRFRREAEITGHLEHPGVVPLYQFGEDTKTGQPFYVMRFVGKRTLADAIIEFHECKSHGGDCVEIHRLITAFLNACQAIAYAHSRGVIHRDLKPENIALDTFGQVVVLDWGLAKLVEEGELSTKLTDQLYQDDSILTRTMAGEVVGTPLYMAPEQAAGDLDHVDERTDVYGLGAILFAILTGCAPHEESLSSKSGQLKVTELLKLISTTKTPSPRGLNPDVPADLEAICMRAMSKKRHARHSTASELAEDVEQWLAGQRAKAQRYDMLRMEGRELRANLQSSIRDLGRNTRFMGQLPPIQGIVDAEYQKPNAEDLQVWRDRLTTIFTGLLRANSDYSAVSYSRVDGDQLREIVRIERHSIDQFNIRSVPASRLLKTEISEFASQVMKQKPDEVYTSLTRPIDSGEISYDECLLSAGVPVFDAETEEPFGIVVLECDFQGILEEQTRQRLLSADQLTVTDSAGNVWICQSGDGEDSACQLVEAEDEETRRIVSAVAQRGEFVDERNREIYAFRLDLVPRKTSLTLKLTVS